jgi:hypothetical protein
MFKGISQCMPTLGIHYFGPFNPFHYSPLPLYFPPRFSTAFSTHPYILCLHRSYVLWYYWYSIILFSFPSFPEFHRAVPLLQTCSTSEFVYDHACFCVYVYFWIYLSCMRESMHLLCLWPWLTLLNMMSSNCIHLPSNPMSLFLVAE